MTQTPSSAHKRVDVFASLESQARLRALDLPVQFKMPEIQSLGLETQQMDEARKADELAQYNEAMRKLLKADKPTGTPHLFVLDPDALAHSEPQARATLQALANAQFSKRDPIAVLFLPPATGTQSIIGKTTADMVKDTIVSDQGCVALESFEALTDWLGQL